MARLIIRHKGGGWEPFENKGKGKTEMMAFFVSMALLQKAFSLGLVTTVEKALERARWIWYPEVDEAGFIPAGERFFRKGLTLERRPIHAKCFVAVDNSLHPSRQRHEGWRGRQLG